MFDPFAPESRVPVRDRLHEQLSCKLQLTDLSPALCQTFDRPLLRPQRLAVRLDRGIADRGVLPRRFERVKEVLAVPGSAYRNHPSPGNDAADEGRAKPRNCLLSLSVRERGVEAQNVIEDRQVEASTQQRAFNAERHDGRILRGHGALHQDRGIGPLGPGPDGGTKVGKHLVQPSVPGDVLSDRGEELRGLCCRLADERDPGVRVLSEHEERVGDGQQGALPVFHGSQHHNPIVFLDRGAPAPMVIAELEAKHVADEACEALPSPSKFKLATCRRSSFQDAAQ